MRLLSRSLRDVADGSVYNQWQSRICYWHIQRLKAEQPHSAMGGFTRLLHRCAWGWLTADRFRVQ